MRGRPECRLHFFMEEPRRTWWGSWRWTCNCCRQRLSRTQLRAYLEGYAAANKNPLDVVPCLPQFERKL